MSVQHKKMMSSMVEALEGRQFLSAAPAVAADAGAAANAAGAGKVSMQDFHFVMRVNKASPTLFASQDGAAGISFVSKPTKHTPGLAASAGKVSMQDFHFVMKNNSTSPK